MGFQYNKNRNKIEKGEIWSKSKAGKKLFKQLFDIITDNGRDLSRLVDNDPFCYAPKEQTNGTT